MKKEQAEFLLAACEDAGFECEMRDNYSGRGMYSKTTHAIVVDTDVCSVLGAVVAYMRGLESSELENVPDLDISQDSMGRDSVVLY